MGRKGKEKHDVNTSGRAVHHDSQGGKQGKQGGKAVQEPPFQEESDNSAKFSKRKIVSNWDKYDEPPSPTEAKKGLDFALFTETKHHTTQEHFRFNDEKSWESHGKLSDYFKLDLKDLSNEILSVPLHERLRLDPSLFTEDQIQIFVKDAKMFEPEYVMKSKEIETKVLSVLKPPQEKAETDSLEWPNMEEQELSSRQSAWENKSDNFFSLSEIDNELDNILSMPLVLHEASDVVTVQESQEELTTTDVCNTMDLQNDWLDSLLGED